MAGEASSSRPKRQRLVEEEDVVTRSGTLLELDLLDCPICCHALSTPIFQCDNGHIACSSCCTKLRKKCPSCTLPIGNYRSRIMEGVVAAVIVPWPNVKHGCTEMVKETNQALAGEASSSCRKRQRVPSIVGEEGENGGGDVVVRFGTLLELDLLDCPVCCDALTKRIFQCDNGHIACSSCCTKLRHKCPSCTFPIGIYRSRIMERVVAAVIVSCPNAEHGCTKTFFYGKELIHEKKCSFALCYCPAPNCNYSGVYKDLYSHYAANHKDTDKRFRYGYSHQTRMFIEEKILVLQEYTHGPLVVLQCFKEQRGFNFTVDCIAPSAPGVGKLSYDLSYSTGDKTVTFTSSEMSKIQKVSFQTPEKDFMLVPDYIVSQMDLSKSMRTMRIYIRRLGEEEEAEEESEEDEEEQEEEAEEEEEQEEEAEEEEEQEEEAEEEEEQEEEEEEEEDED